MNGGVLSTDGDGIDANIPRKKAIFANQLQFHPNSGAPLFAKLELSLTGLCNRQCVFCPRVDPKVYANVREHMSLRMFGDILTSLSGCGWAGTVSYSGFGEPLLHPEIEALVELFHQRLPEARSEMVTNGDRLDLEILQSLFNKGLTVMIVSLYDGPEQLERFLKMRNDAGIEEDRMLLRIRYKPAEENFGMTLSNRGGSVELGGFNVPAQDATITASCYYPHYSIFVEYDGTVLLCCNDWEKKKTMGNVGQCDLITLWQSSEMDEVRRSLLGGERCRWKTCASCNVKGTLMGEEHAEAWRRILY